MPSYHRILSRPRKYEPGGLVKTAEYLEVMHRDYLQSSQGKFVFVRRFGRSLGGGEYGYRDQLVHVAFAVNRPFALCNRDIRLGHIREAVISQLYKEWLEAEYRSVFKAVALIEEKKP